VNGIIWFSKGNWVHPDKVAFENYLLR